MDVDMNSIMRRAARKVVVGKKYKLPNMYVIKDDGNHPVQVCTCVGKYKKYATFRTPRGNIETFSYFDLASGIASEYRRSVSYVSDKNKEFLVSLL